MRPLESLLLLTNLLTFILWVLGPPVALRWMRFAAPAAILVAVAQILVEGLRWQMVPAYGLTGLFLLFWLPHQIPRAGGLARWRGTHGPASGLTAGLGLIGLVVSAVLPVVLPVFRFPHPTGPFAIGTLTYHWVDGHRAEIFGADPNARRELVVQVWYPATASPSSRYAPYMQDADVVMATFARIQQLPDFVFGHFKYVRTNAITAAPVAGDTTLYPVLLFLEGATGYRQMNTFQIENLVSQGYIVAAIDQPGAAANVVFPDARQAIGLTLTQFRATVGPSYFPNNSAPFLNGRLLDGGSIIPYLAQDVSFTLDQLAALNQSDPHRLLTGRLDLQRVGAFGISLGGIVAGEACRVEPRLRACLVMDAPMPTSVVNAGLRQPGMWITRDTATMRLEAQRTGGWSAEEIEAHQTTMRSVYESLPGAGYYVQVPGMFHSNFTDIPLWSPLASQVGLTGPINGQRAHRIVNAYTLAFFDRHLASRPAPLLDGPSRQYQEVLYESRGRW